MEAWPRLIEEMRILTSSAGRSIPQALFEVGRRAPVELQPAFEAAHREWLLTTDFARTTSTLKRELADPAADATCETLLVAQAIGGTDIASRLEALAEDRRQDVQGRKDARARQAGVRFARRFVLLVPLGMAMAGTSVGTGRAAYRTPLGQLMVTAALLMVAGCWWWAGRLLRLPEPERVFPR
jgi:tight adherence protein B